MRRDKIARRAHSTMRAYYVEISRTDKLVFTRAAACLALSSTSEAGKRSSSRALAEIVVHRRFLLGEGSQIPVVQPGFEPLVRVEFPPCLPSGGRHERLVNAQTASAGPIVAQSSHFASR
jgi:hypothetical protein